MSQSKVTQIDVKQVLEEKAPSLAKRVPGFAVRYLKRIVHQDEVNDILRRYHDKDGVEFMNALVDHFDLNLQIIHEENIPANDGKRYIFASNHPLGGLDGICLSSVIGSRFDNKVRYPVNDILLFIPNLRSIFVPVNKHGSQGREAARLIDEAFASDNQIITFPAGLCSRKIKGEIVDLEWKKSFVQKAIAYRRDIVPVYFSGKNSHFFYNLANFRHTLGIKANIEMLYLSDEMFKSKQKTFQIYFGSPIPWQSFDKSKTMQEWALWIKNNVYHLSLHK